MKSSDVAVPETYVTRILSSKSLVLVILGLALVLLLSAAAQKSFWEDEAFTANAVKGSFAELLKVTQRDVHPPLYLVTLKLWSSAFGATELPLRAFSIFFSLAALFLAYQLSRDLLGKRAALFTLLLMAFSPLFIMYGQNARYYSMATALSLLVVYSMLGYQRHDGWFHLVVYIAAAVALLYLLFAAGTVIVACNLWWFWKWYKGDRNNGERSSWLPWILAQLGIVLCYLPGLEIMISVAGKYASQPLVMGELAGDILKRIGFLGFAFSIGETFSPLNPVAWIGLSLIVIAVISALIHLGKKKNVLLPVILLAVIGAVNILISLIPYVAQTWQNLPYRMLYGYPFFVMLVGVGLDRLRPWMGNMLGGLLLGVFAIGLFNYYSDRQFIRPIYTVPWRQIFDRIQAEEESGAVVICNSGDYACSYYARRYFQTAYGPASWQKLAGGNPAEVWWIESNKGTPLPKQDLETNVLQEIQHDYRQVAILHYAPQDPSIRWIKAKLLKREDYTYRVNIYQFRLKNSANY